MPPATFWLIAGPDGTGRTTFAFRRIAALSGETSFVNVDEIRRGLSPLAHDREAVRASRVALKRIDDLIDGNGRGRRSFSLETTLAGRTHLRTVARAKRAGFAVRLLFFAVATPEEALRRIARRVAEGGHDVPEPDARRRFTRSIANVPLYARLADLWQVFDANGSSPRLVAEGAGATVAFRGAQAGLPPPLPPRPDAGGSAATSPGF